MNFIISFLGEGMTLSKIRSIMLILALSLIFSISGQSSANAEDYFSFDSGLNVEGRTILPMRSLFESLGATVTWDQNTKTVTATKEQTTIVLTIGSKQAKVNGKAFTIDVPALVIDGRTYVPVRFVTESLGATVDWNSYLNRATVFYDNKRVDIYVSPALNVSGVKEHFRLNPSYTYVYQYYEGSDKLTFVGMQGNQYIWNSQYTYVETDPVSKVYFEENQYGLYKTIHSSWWGSSTTQELKYPAYVGQSWGTEEYGEYATRTIVAVGSTIQTPVKTFDHVIEVMDDDGIIRYYAKDFGLVAIESIDGMNEVMSVGLKALKKR